MTMKLIAILLALMLFTSASLIFFTAHEVAAKADISVAMKAKKKVTLLAIKNNSNLPVYSFEIKSLDGAIRFIKVMEWDRQKTDQSTVMIRTSDKPITQGSNMIVLLILDKKDSVIEWQAFGINEVTHSPVLLNRGSTASSGTETVPKEESKPAYSCMGHASCFTAAVTRIVDGDTIDVENGSNTVTIRLALTNTPEIGQPLYKEATKFTSVMCFVGSTAIIDEDDGQTKGSYGRMIAEVFCNDKILNAELLYAHLAVIDTRFCNESEFAGEMWAQQYGCGQTVQQEQKQPTPPAPTPAPPATPPATKKKLSVDIDVKYPTITRGSTQAISVIVSSDGSVSGASVSAIVTYASGSTQKSFQGTTDSSGMFTFSWQIGGNSTPGTFVVKVSASKQGYESGSASTTFQVVPKSGY